MTGRGASKAAGQQMRWPRVPVDRNPLLPHAVLSVILLTAGVSAALFALVPADADTRRVALVVAVLFILASGFAWWLAPRLPGGWGLDVAILAAVTVTVGMGVAAAEPESQVLLGLGMILLVVFAAYCRPAARFLTELVYAGVLYAVIALWLQPLMRPVYCLVVLLVTAVVGVSVAILVAQLREMAVTDTLTGVPNRRGLLIMAEYLQAEARRSHMPLTAVLLDIDRFKAFNDRHGHLAGDRLLVEVAQTLRAGLRATDTVARFGGDEFAIVLRGVDAGTARGLLDRIQPPARDVSWSAGIAAWDPSEPLETALSAADDDLYRIKRH